MTCSNSQSTADAPAVSVVIPTFNASRWIRETLASVVVQTIGVDALEVIVVDDGSADDTSGIAERWLADRPIRSRVIRQLHRNVCHARNVGWQNASAEWIQFLDADDVIAPEKIQLQLGIAMTVSDNTAVIYSSWSKFGLLDPRWESGEPATPMIGDDPVTDLLSGTNSIATGAQLYNRRWLERVGGWDEMWPTIGEDHHLAFRVAFAGGGFVYAPSDRPLFYYRRHGPSLSTRSGRENAACWLQLAAFVEEQSRQRHELTQKRIARIKSLYAGGSIWLAHYDWASARDWIDRLLQLEPSFQLRDRKKIAILSSLVGFKRAVWIASRIRRFLPVRESQRVSCDLASQTEIRQRL